MIDVQYAVRTAVEYCPQLFGDIADRFLLEEVELSADEKHWFITVGFDGPSFPQKREPLVDPLYNYMPQVLERKYKVVDVDAESGTIRAVKIRQPFERIS